MALDGKMLVRARARLEDRRRENAEELKRRTAQTYLLIPELERTDTELRSQMPELVKLTISRSPELKARLEELRQENLALQAHRDELLTQHGYPVDWLDEIFTCKRCRDTGYTDDGLCSCLMALYNSEMTAELSGLIRSGDECFEKFDLSYYGSPSETGGFSAYHQMKAVFDLCKNYAENFKPSTVSLLFRGSPGVGKTYLSACIARVVAGKGYSVCYDTAASALEAFELRKFARDPETAETAGVKVRRMLDCDLMILDDLGTEMTTYISISALYTLINTRLLTGKPTIISTNLLDDELEKRYSPQICSRIQGEYSTLQFAGADARRRNKG